MAPWADVLYACDFEWWSKNDGVTKFGGLKISNDEKIAPAEWRLRQVHLVRADDSLLINKFGEIGWGGNSGFHALNLAVQFGAKRIVLVGFDMRVDNGVHWHGKHGGGLHNPTSANTNRWRRAIDATAPLLDEIGVEVLNASPVSALENFKKIDFESLFT